MTRLRSAPWALLAVVATMLALVGCGQRDVLPRQGGVVFAVGDCVEIPAGTPESADTDPLRASKVPCSIDPSYTVGATTNASGSCPSDEYQHLPTQFADPSTARLCLVPNLVAEHCYVLEMPIGVMQRADCADRGGQGMLVQITQRLDVRDQGACPSDVGHFAWPYPSPPRTYCTLTIF